MPSNVTLCIIALGKALLLKVIKDKVADDDVRASFKFEKGDM